MGANHRNKPGSKGQRGKSGAPARRSRPARDRRGGRGRGSAVAGPRRKTPGSDGPRSGGNSRRPPAGARGKPGAKGGSRRSPGGAKGKLGAKGGRKPPRPGSKPRPKSSRNPRKKPGGPSPRAHDRKGDRRGGPTGGSKGRRPARKPDRKPPHTGVGPDNLPKWLREEIRRVTRSDRQAAALRVMAEAVDAYGDGEFGAARRKLHKAKDLSPRASPVREYLGLSAYHVREWGEALAELRAYRRFTGETTYMPFEMDSLRALKRGADVEKTWERFVEWGGNRPTEAEARVVYGSYLLDQDRAAEAWRVTGPSRISHDARPYELRVWFVAARAALALGEFDTAAQLTESIRRVDPDLPGLEDLMDRIAGHPRRRRPG